jgi:hypothetical protein
MDAIIQLTLGIIGGLLGGVLSAWVRRRPITRALNRLSEGQF